MNIVGRGQRQPARRGRISVTIDGAHALSAAGQDRVDRANALRAQAAAAGVPQPIPAPPVGRQAGEPLGGRRRGFKSKAALDRRASFR